jgi:hypothetical protein
MADAKETKSEETPKFKGTFKGIECEIIKEHPSLAGQEGDKVQLSEEQAEQLIKEKFVKKAK